MSISDLFYIDATGIHAPDYPTTLTRIQDQYKSVYGSDVYLGDDSQDGQWLALQAIALYETMQIGVGVYRSFSPATAQGEALSSNVKINGITRDVATFSQVDLTIIGQAGKQINNGQAKDQINQLWNLPPIVIIPVSGEITVTAIANDVGAIPAQPNTITIIATPTDGWQSVNNPFTATLGEPIEPDDQLRRKQSVSTMQPNQTVLDGIDGAVRNVPGVIKTKTYENDTQTTNLDGIPANSIAVVVEGGDAEDIAEAIGNKKPPGIGTFGNTSEQFVDSRGVFSTIYFSRPPQVIIGVQIVLEPRNGFLSSTADQIKESVAQYISTLDIGDDVYISKVYCPANLENSDLQETFVIRSLELNKNAGIFAPADIILTYDEQAFTGISDVDISYI